MMDVISQEIEIPEEAEPLSGETQFSTSTFCKNEFGMCEEEVVVMDEAGLEEYQIVEQDVSINDSEDPMTTRTEALYVISTILDDETGEMINILTPVSQSEIMNTMDIQNLDTDANSTHGMEFPEPMPEELESQPQDEPLEINFMNEHDYGGDIPSRLIEIHDSSDPAVQIDFEGQDPNQNLVFTTEDETHFPSMSSSSTSSSPTKIKKKKMKKGVKTRVVPKPRNIDLMDLPFTYPGQSFTVQAQKLILNVYDFFKRNKHDEYVLDRIPTPQERASRCLNISSCAIGKIRRRYKSGKLEVPGRRKPKIKSVLDKVDAEKEQILREMLRERLNNGDPMSLPALLAEARQRINFDGSRTSFGRILHRLGFKCRNRKSQVAVI